jgi:transposase
LPVLWRIPDDLWELIRVTLPAVELRPNGGRRWIAPRRIVDGVLFVLRTGCQWKLCRADRVAACGIGA